MVVVFFVRVFYLSSLFADGVRDVSHKEDRHRFTTVFFDDKHTRDNTISLVKARFENFDALLLLLRKRRLKKERSARVVESADRGNARVYI